MTTSPIRITDSKTVRDNGELMAQVDELARKERRTRSNMLEVLLREALERRESEEQASRN